MAKDESVKFRVESEIRKLIDDAAADEVRTRSNWLRKVIKDKLREEGYLPRFRCKNCGAEYPAQTWNEALIGQTGNEDIVPIEEDHQAGPWYCPNCSIGLEETEAVEVEPVE